MLGFISTKDLEIRFANIHIKFCWYITFFLYMTMWKANKNTKKMNNSSTKSTYRAYWYNSESSLVAFLISCWVACFKLRAHSVLEVRILISYHSSVSSHFALLDKLLLTTLYGYCKRKNAFLMDTHTQYPKFLVGISVVWGVKNVARFINNTAVFLGVPECS